MYLFTSAAYCEKIYRALKDKPRPENHDDWMELRSDTSKALIASHHAYNGKHRKAIKMSEQLAEKWLIY